MKTWNNTLIVLLALKLIKKKMQIEVGLDLEQNKNWNKIKK